MGGLIRGVLILLVVVVVVVAGGVTWLAMNLNDLVRNGVQDRGPDYTGTPVTLESVDLSLFSGEGELRGLVVGNPEGFEGEDPFRLGRVRVALDTSTLTQDVIVVREIIVEEAEINAILKSLRNSNLQAILDNVEAASGPEEAPSADSGEPLKVIIDRFSFSGGAASVTAAQAGSARVEIPDIVLTGIGRKSNGETVGEALSQMIGPVVAAIVQAGVDGQLRDLVGGQLQQMQDRVRDAAGGLLDRLGGRRPGSEQQPPAAEAPPR
ncbi:MAG: hypothetical protein V2J24_02265 [Pseudomonadales bacterium]|jgi:hypothetical protein|nr:hypothetical protein [Pseudomonadales bacterium]